MQINRLIMQISQIRSWLLIEFIGNYVDHEIDLLLFNVNENVIILHNCSGIALELLWNCSGTALELLWNAYANHKCFNNS